MDPRDIAFPLRTGGGGGAVDWNSVQTMMALMMVFTTKACEDAQAYASAAGRRTVTAHDLILGLKYNAVPSTGFYGTESLGDKVRAWRDSALVGDMVTVAQGGRVEDEEESDFDEEEEEEWSPGPAEHAFVARVHAAEAEYDGWEPEGFEGRIVKRAIERAILRAEA
jgi:hypothetical protein